MEKNVSLKPTEKEFAAHISEAFTIMAAFKNDIIIVSAESEKIEANRTLLSVYSPTLASFLLTSSTIILPDCSSQSVKVLLSIITRGFTKFDIVDILEVVETAKILGIKVKNIKPELMPIKCSVKSKTETEGINEEEIFIDSSINKSNLNDKVSTEEQIYDNEIKENSEYCEKRLVEENEERSNQNQESIERMDTNTEVEDTDLVKVDSETINIQGDFQKVFEEIRNNINNITEKRKGFCNSTQLKKQLDSQHGHMKCMECRFTTAQDTILEKHIVETHQLSEDNEHEGVMEETSDSDIYLNNTTNKNTKKSFDSDTNNIDGTENLEFKTTKEINIETDEQKVIVADENVELNAGIKKKITHQCQICSKYFPRLFTLQYHYAMQHFKEDLLNLTDFINANKCIPCDKIMTRQYVLLVHVGIYHRKINLFLSNQGLRKLKQSKCGRKKLDKEQNQTSLVKRTGLKTKQMKKLSKIKGDMKKQKSPGKSKIIKRKHFSSEQLAMLTAEFERSETLDKSSCNLLSKNTGLEIRQIKKWFYMKKWFSNKKRQNIIKYRKNKTKNEALEKTEQPKLMIKANQVEFGDIKKKEKFSKKQKAILKEEVENSKTKLKSNEDKESIRNTKNRIITLLNSDTHQEFKKSSENSTEQKIKIKDMTPKQKREYQRQRKLIRNKNT